MIYNVEGLQDKSQNKSRNKTGKFFRVIIPLKLIGYETLK